MLTPETLTRHELVGLPVRVADAANPDLVGISGRVVSETMRTLVIASAASPLDGAAAAGSRERQVPKRGTTFEFELTDSSDSVGGTAPTDTIEPVGGTAPTDTIDEAASDRKVAGDALEREQETAGVRPGQSCSTGTGSRAATQAAARDCEDALYVTVDGTRLLSRPALRTETTGDTTWQSD